jgi:hypothetical protein
VSLPKKSSAASDHPAQVPSDHLQAVRTSPGLSQTAGLPSGKTPPSAPLSSPSQDACLPGQSIIVDSDPLPNSLSTPLPPPMPWPSVSARCSDPGCIDIRRHNEYMVGVLLNASKDAIQTGRTMQGNIATISGLRETVSSLSAELGTKTTELSDAKTSMRETVASLSAELDTKTTELSEAKASLRRLRVMMESNDPWIGAPRVPHRPRFERPQWSPRRRSPSPRPPRIPRSPPPRDQVRFRGRHDIRYEWTP